MRKPESFAPRARAVAGAAAMLLASGLGLPAPGEAAPYEITRWTVDGGGASPRQAGPYTCGGTVGQPDAGRLSRLSYALAGGFWGSLAPAVVGVADTLDGDPAPLPGGVPEVRQARIHPPAPNPLFSHTRIAFELPDTREVEITVFDIHGSLVRTLAEGPRPSGRYTVEWDTRGVGGQRVGSGIYFVRVRLGALEKSLKLVVMR